MTRAAAGGSLALLVAMALVVGGSGQAAATGDCVWAKHSKRVVKKVKRKNGQTRRVRRTKHWWACDPVPVPAALAPVPPTIPPPPPPPPPPEEEEPGVGRLGVRAQEFSYTLSRPEVAAGELIVELNNLGEDPHDLNLLLEGSEEPPLALPTALPQQQTSERFDLPPGTYRLWCDIGEHDEYGMNATLTVKPH